MICIQQYCLPQLTKLWWFFPNSWATSPFLKTETNHCTWLYNLWSMYLLVCINLIKISNWYKKKKFNCCHKIKGILKRTLITHWYLEWSVKSFFIKTPFYGFKVWCLPNQTQENYSTNTCTQNRKPKTKQYICIYLFTSYSNFHQSGNLILVKKKSNLMKLNYRHFFCVWL